jgi:hypothetical protein
LSKRAGRARDDLLDEVGVRQHSINIILQRQHAEEQGVGLSPSRFKIMYASQDYWRSQRLATILDFRSGEPDSCHDRIIQLACFITLKKLRSKDQAQELLPRLRVNPEISTNQLAAGNLAASFFENFSKYRGLRRFSSFNVSARLAEHNSAHRVLFIEKIATIVNTTAETVRSVGYSYWLFERFAWVYTPSWRNSSSTSLANQISSNILLYSLATGGS